MTVNSILRITTKEPPIRIAQIAPLYESVPPKNYGGTERIVSYLTEALVDLGHEVTLFASGDSVTSARLSPQSPASLRLDKKCKDHIAHHVLMIEHVYQRLEEFDIIHSHIDYMAFPMVRRSSTPVVTTLHGRLDLPDLVPVYQEYKDVSLISISNDQRKPLPWANWVGTVYHGIPGSVCRCHENPGTYLAFLGRISPEKRPDRAIEIAKKVRIPLRMAAKVDSMDKKYYAEKIVPLMDHSLIQFLGEISEEEKSEFLGNALALLVPIDWPEPFGLVMIEAMSCGTPVIAFRCGSVPEVVEDGVTGFICDSMEEAAAAVEKCRRLDRRGVREAFEKRFTAARMAEDYLSIYRRQLGIAAPREGGGTLVRHY